MVHPFTSQIHNLAFSPGFKLPWLSQWSYGGAFSIYSKDYKSTKVAGAVISMLLYGKKVIYMEVVLRLSRSLVKMPFSPI
ncbi:unnamed protein product [Citrullus colocynthis]|uniref:Uncharacterized protein n=1 Tax=Citrullus colocynthis TaxID=252529 RepID=A0ABP0Y0D2_9ROSI